MNEKLIISVQEAGKERGKRIYFNNRDLKTIKEKYGDDFFLFQEKKLFAQVDVSNEKIIITPIPQENFEINNGITGDTELKPKPFEPFESLEDVTKDLYDYDNLIDDLNYEPSQLDFYIPMEGNGEKFWIAEITIEEKLAFYCVAPSISLLRKEIKRKSKKHFPGLLDLKNIRKKFTNDYLVYSPVPNFIANNAYDQISNKKIDGTEIPTKISIPNDADLTPIVNMGKGSVKDIEIKNRGILAKYEINAIVSEKYTVKDIKIIEIDGKVVWEVLTDNSKKYFDLIDGSAIKDM